MSRLLIAVSLAISGSGFTFQEPQPSTSDAKRLPVLPGVQPSGAILLPNQWSLRPAGKHIQMGDFPVNLAMHPAGQWLAALHAGYGEHEIIIVNLKSQKIASRVILPQTFYGLCFSPDGKSLFASGGEYEVVHAFDFNDGLLERRRDLRIVDVKQKFIPGGLAVNPGGKTLFVAGTWGDGVCLLSLETPTDKTIVSTGKESYPYAVAIDPAGKRFYVSLWNKAGVAVFDLAEKKATATWPTEKHPTEMALSPDGKTLFVACANSTKVSVLDTATGKGLETISCSSTRRPPSGNTPNSLA